MLGWTRAGLRTEVAELKYAVVGSKIEISKSLRAVKSLKKLSFQLTMFRSILLCVFGQLEDRLPVSFC